MAKIRFENGVVVNFNGDPTPQDVEEVAKKLGISKQKSSFIGDIKQSIKSRTDALAEGYLRQQQGKQSVGESILQTVGQGAGVIGDVAFSGVSRLASAITPDVIEKPVVEAGKKLLTKAVSTPLVSGAISKYQQFEKEQPRAAANIGAIGNIASMLPVGKAGGVAGKAVGQTALKTAKVAGKVGEQVAAKGANISKFGISQISGLNRETIEQIIKNPKAFTKETVDAISRESLGKQVKEGITNRINQLKEVGNAYEPIRKTAQVIDVPVQTYTEPLAKYGLQLNNEGKLLATAESKPFSVGELNQIENFLQQYGGLQHTPNSALNAREALANIAKYDMTKSNNLTSLAKDMRSSFNNIIRNEKTGIQGLKSIDDIYSAETKVLKEIKKDYFVKGTNEFKDNALSKIANLTKEGRQSVLNRLKEIDPNIESKVNILKAVEDIKASGGLKVGTYARGVAGVGGLATGNIGLLLTAIAAQPEILVPILRAWGRIRLTQKGFVSSLENKLKKGIDLATNEKSFINQAIDSYAKKVGDYAKNIKPGLTIEDVSKKLDPKNFKTAEDYVKAQATRDGVATRFGEISKDGAYFSKQVDGFENKNYFNAKTGNIKNAQYDISKANIVKSDTKEALTVLNEALKDTNNTPQDIIRLKREINSANEYGGRAVIDWRLNDEIPSIVKAAKKLGYDGINVIETGDVSKPTSLFIWNTNKINELKTKSQLISEWNKAQKLKSSLIQEAKKYKSAEEFIKSQPKLFRYGSEIDLTRGNNRGISFTKTAKEAIDYQYGVGGAIRPGGKIDSAVLDKGAKILKEKDIPKGLLDSTEQDYDSLIKYARKNNYDAVEIGDIAGENEIRILNPKKLTTRQQLIDIWKKSQKLR